MFGTIIWILTYESKIMVKPSVAPGQKCVYYYVCDKHLMIWITLR